MTHVMGWGGGGSSPPFLSLFVSNSAKYGKGGGVTQRESEAELGL